MGCEQLDPYGNCKADPEARRCIAVPNDVCRENFKYKKVGQLTLAPKETGIR